ncbi:MAG: alpha/beta fold hydrolase [Bacteroidota bacterium]
MKLANLNTKKIVLLAFLLLLGVVLYFVMFVSDIPVTTPNVNEKTLGSLEQEIGFISNRWGDSMEVESNRLVVPEIRGQESSNHIEIFFNRIKSRANEPMSPIFFLAGGPGSSASEVAQGKYFYVFEALAAYADVILLDQRGTGLSLPNLACRNNLSLPTDITQDVQQAILQNVEESVGACGAEFKRMGIDLRGYNSTESAMDIDEIRKVLGYERISLYGYSYGTELAQHYLRRFEHRVDRLILAGSLGPDHGVKMPLDVQAQYETMDSLIKQDKRLSHYIPDFLKLVRTTHNKLQTTPQFIQVPMQDAFDDEGIEQFIGNVVAKVRPTWDMTLTHDHLQMIISDKVGQDYWISRLPEIYYNMSNNEYRFIGNQLRNFRRRRLPNAVFFTVNAQTGYSDDRWQLALDQSKEGVFSHFGISYGRYRSVTDALGVSKRQGMNEPVYSSRPVLLISGSLDGRTPHRLTRELAMRFANSRSVMVTNRGHNELMNNDIFDAMVLFLKDSLRNDTILHRDIQFRNPVPYRYSMVDTLMNDMATATVENAMKRHRTLYYQYLNSTEYDFDTSVRPFYDLAERLHSEKKFSELAEITQYASQKYVDDPYLFFYLALAHEQLGNHELAIEAAEQALQIDYFEGNSRVLLDRLIDR